MPDFATYLAETGYEFVHHSWSGKQPPTYGVYAEDEVQALWADGKKAEEALHGTVDLYTRDDTAQPRVNVEAALDLMPIYYELASIQYEEETGYIHYEWAWVVS